MAGYLAECAFAKVLNMIEVLLESGGCALAAAMASRIKPTEHLMMVMVCCARVSWSIGSRVVREQLLGCHVGGQIGCDGCV